MLHWTIPKHFGKTVTKNWYKHHPKPVTEIEYITTLQDFIVYADRKIYTNRPDIIRSTKTKLLVDIAISANCNISHKEFEKLSNTKI